MFFLRKTFFYLTVLFCIGLFFATHVRAESDALNQVSLYLNLGQTENAKKLLNDFLATESDPDSILRAKGFLGNAHALEGKYREAIAIYEDLYRDSNGQIKMAAANNLTSTSKDLVEKLDRDLVLVDGEGDLKGVDRLKVEISQQKEQTAIYRERALKLTEGHEGEGRISALLNADLVEEATELVASLPSSPKKVNFLLQLANKSAQPLPYLLEARSLAKEPRSLSFVLQQLGEFHYSAGNYDLAESFTEGAIDSAQSIFAHDLLYQQWDLLGDIYTKQGNKGEIEAWRNSIASIQKIRGDLAIAARNDQLDFDSQIDPIYRKLIDFLLKAGKIKEAISLADLRQLSELEAFFGDACLILSEDILPKHDGTAVISTFIFDSRTEVILQLPSGSYYRNSIEINRPQFIAKITEYRRDLENSFVDSFKKTSQEFYNLFLRPFQSQLEGVKELVFVGDGILRNVPMASLFDGERFLIEKYPISYSLSSNLKTATVKSNGNSLIFGLSVAVGDWLPLTGVVNETSSVSNIVGGDRVLDGDFTVSRFAKSIEEKQPSIIHIATHGKFVGTLERSFLLAFDGKISLPEMERAFNSSNINLLVLSACQTAAGNSGSVMGLAGVALLSNIPNTIGALWSIEDLDTADSIDSFYTYLKQGFSYAEALQKMQIERIRTIDQHPSNWSSFIVLTN